MNSWMKHLEEYLKRFGHKEGFLVLDREEELELFFGYLPEGFIEDPYRDYILENLNTHSEKELQKQLQKHFKISRFQDESIKGTKNGENVAFRFFIADKNYDEDELKRLLSFYGWYISKESNIKGGYLVAPTYSENKTDYIWQNCTAGIFHICKKKDLAHILKSGLRIKNTKQDLEGQLAKRDYKKYRDFPERIYVVAAPEKEIIKAVYNCCIEMEMEQADIDERAIIRLRSANNFYSDDVMDNEYAFFTYTNVPARAIFEAWDLNEFLKNGKKAEHLYYRRYNNKGL